MYVLVLVLLLLFVLKLFREVVVDEFIFVEDEELELLLEFGIIIFDD
jgi:hypothetical protein